MGLREGQGSLGRGTEVVLKTLPGPTHLFQRASLVALMERVLLGGFSTEPGFRGRVRTLLCVVNAEWSVKTKVPIRFPGARQRGPHCFTERHQPSCKGSPSPLTPSLSSLAPCFSGVRGVFSNSQGHRAITTVSGTIFHHHPEPCRSVLCPSHCQPQ